MSNPILRRELIQLWRIRTPRRLLRWLGLLVLCGAIIGVILSLRPASDDQVIRWRNTFFELTYTQLFLVCAVSPVFYASAFSGERERRTLEPLILTRLTPAEICRGKLLARMTSVGLVLAVFAPFVAFTARAARIAPEILVGVYGLLAVCSFTSATLGTSWSFTFRRTHTAMLFCVAAPGIVWPIFLLFLHSLALSGASPAAFWAYVWEVQPFTALAALADPLRDSGCDWVPGWSNWLHTLFWHGGLGALLFLGLCFDLRRLPPERYV